MGQLWLVTTSFKSFAQLKDGRGKGEYVLIYFIKIGSGDKNVPLYARAYISFLFLSDWRWFISELDFIAKQYTIKLFQKRKLAIKGCRI